MVVYIRKCGLHLIVGFAHNNNSIKPLRTDSQQTRYVNHVLLSGRMPRHGMIAFPRANRTNFTTETSFSLQAKYYPQLYWKRQNLDHIFIYGSKATTVYSVGTAGMMPL